MKQSGSSTVGQMIIAGLTSEPKDAPGPFGNYELATTNRMDRSVTVAGKDTLMEEDWEFVAASGERLEVHLKYERAPARKGGSEVKFFSPTNPSSYQIFKIEQGIDIMRNATVPVRDRVKEFSYKAAGGRLGPLFDGNRARRQHQLLPLIQSRHLSAVACRGRHPDKIAERILEAGDTSADLCRSSLGLDRSSALACAAASPSPFGRAAKQKQIEEEDHGPQHPCASARRRRRAGDLPGAGRRRDFGSLVNADKEPQNWLMNHRTYDAQRYSPLDKVNKDNVKSLKLAYALAIGGTAANENLQATPLAEDGFLYVVDQWGVVYKIDVRSGDMGRIVWRMDPGQEKLPLSNRGAALLGNLVISTANYPARVIATNKDNGKVVWETNLARPAGRADHRRAAGGQGQGHHWRRRRRSRRARLDRGARWRLRQADLAQIRRAGTRRTRQRNLEGQEQRLADRRRRHVDHGLL